MPVVEQNVEDGVEVEEAPKKAKKTAVTKVPGGKGKIVKKAAKKAPKEDSEERVRAGEVLQGEILSFMRKGTAYTSREVVEGLGRTPGNAEGQPVVNQLHKLVEEKKVKKSKSEGRGFSWVKL